MDRLQAKRVNKNRRSHRVRSVVVGASEKPRLSVSISNKHISAQIIDDSKSTSLVSVSSANGENFGTQTEKAEFVGTQIAKKAKAKKIVKVSFDRGGRMYHGKVKALADAARKGGLEF